MFMELWLQESFRSSGGAKCSLTGFAKHCAPQELGLCLVDLKL